MKTKKTFCFTAAFLLSIIVAGGLWAQATDPDNANSLSPTNATTNGRFKTAIDDYISPQDYTNLKLNNWFGYASWTTVGQPQPQFGFAKQIKNLYLAIYFKGTFWGGLNNFANREETVANFMGGADDKKLTTYTMPAPLDNPDNSGAIIIGFADMGIRLGFSSTYDSFKNDGDLRIESRTVINTYDYYRSYKLENGNLVPQIKWGMAKDLVSRGIRPYVTATLNFHRENAKADEYLAVDKTSGEKILYSLNYIQPSLAVGLGGFTFYNANGFKGSVDLDYTLRLNVYSNDYSYPEDNSPGVAQTDYIYNTKTIKGTWGPISATDTRPILRERSNIFNSIAPSVIASWSSGNLGLKAKLRANFDIDSTKTTDMNVIRDSAGKTNGDLQREGDNEVRNTFTFTPRFDLALQYTAIPERLTLNVGGRIARGISVHHTTAKVYDINGNEDASKTATSKSTSFGSMIHRLYAGALFNFTRNVWVEAATGIENGVNVFSTGANGLFNFTAISIGLKF
jgi:hypothetical protein